MFRSLLSVWSAPRLQLPPAALSVPLFRYPPAGSSAPHFPTPTAAPHCPVRTAPKHPRTYNSPDEALPADRHTVPVILQGSAEPVKACPQNFRFPVVYGHYQNTGSDSLPHMQSCPA